MVTQTVEYRSIPISGQLATLYSSNTVIASGTGVATSRPGKYTVDYTNVPAGTYELIATSGNTLASWWVDLTFNTDTFQAYDTPPSLIADGVWNASYSDYTTAGTFGKLIDIIRKSNLSIDGTVASNISVSGFNTDLTGANGTYDHLLLVFTDGSLVNVSRPINYSLQTNGFLALQEDLPSVPGTGDAFVIVLDHIHPTGEFVEAATIALTNYDPPTRAELTADKEEIINAIASGVVNVISSGAFEDIFSTYAVPESYASQGAEGTPAQLFYFIQQVFSEFAISGTTITAKKLDGTTAATFTLDSSTSPTSRTRAT